MLPERVKYELQRIVMQPPSLPARRSTAYSQTDTSYSLLSIPQGEMKPKSSKRLQSHAVKSAIRSILGWLLLLIILVRCDDKPPVDERFVIKPIVKESSTVIYVNHPLSLDFQIQGRYGFHKLTYFKFQSSIKALVSYAGKTYEPDQNIPVDSGAQDIAVQFIPKELSDRIELSFLFVGARSKQLVKVPLALSVKDAPFHLRLSSHSDTLIYLNQRAALRFEIQAESAESKPSSFGFKSPMGGVLIYEQIAYRPGDSIPINPGETRIDAVFKPDKIGEQLDFYLMADGFSPQHLEVPLVVRPISWTLDVEPTRSVPISILSGSGISVKISPQLKDLQGLSWSWTYHIEKGTGKIAGTDQTNPAIPIEPNQKQHYTYHPDSTGSHKIRITASDNYGNTKTQYVSFYVVVPLKITKVDVYYNKYNDLYARFNYQRGTYTFVKEVDLIWQVGDKTYTACEHVLFHNDSIGHEVEFHRYHRDDKLPAVGDSIGLQLVDWGGVRSTIFHTTVTRSTQ